MYCFRVCGHRANAAASVHAPAEVSPVSASSHIYSGLLNIAFTICTVTVFRANCCVVTDLSKLAGSSSVPFGHQILQVIVYCYLAASVLRIVVKKPQPRSPSKRYNSIYTVSLSYLACTY